jgi:hypothetical protein
MKGQTYTIVNTSSHNTATRRPPHTSYAQQHTTTHNNSTRVHKITNVPLFKKLWDIIFFCWDNHNHNHNHNHNQKKVCARDNLRGQKSLGPLKMSLEMAHKVIVPQKKIMSSSFLNSGTLIVINTPWSPKKPICKLLHCLTSSRNIIYLGKDFLAVPDMPINSTHFDKMNKTAANHIKAI